ncbi:hypothetical protein BOTBODRAFT_74987, partial [Botryobasidium botryosum FD-172 SS1]
LPKNRARKLAPKFIGPYTVLKSQPETSNYTLDLPAELLARRINPTFHISRLKPMIPSDDARFPDRDNKVEYDFGKPDEGFIVESITSHGWVNRKLMFQVKWALGDITWEPLVSCQGLATLDEYLVLQGVSNPKDL